MGANRFFTLKNCTINYSQPPLPHLVLLSDKILQVLTEIIPHHYFTTFPSSAPPSLSFKNLLLLDRLLFMLLFSLYLMKCSSTNFQPRNIVACTTKKKIEVISIHHAFHEGLFPNLDSAILWAFFSAVFESVQR